MGLSKFFKSSKKAKTVAQTPQPPLPTKEKDTFVTSIPNSSSSSTENSYTASRDDSGSTSVSTTSSNNIHASSSNNSTLPKELTPIITLLNAQNTRLYIQSQVNVINEITDEVLVLTGLVRGNQAYFYDEDPESPMKPIVIDILSSSLRLESALNAFVLNEKYQVRLIDQSACKAWIAAIKLSNYEYTKLSEAYTASLLSCKGLKLSDIHVVLSENRFVYEEDCSIKFQSGDGARWISCRVVVTPRKNSKTNGSIEFYTGGGSKTSGKKKLMCRIDSIDSAHAVFPHVDLIDSTSIIKVNGDFSVFKIEEDCLSPSVVQSRSRSSSLASQIAEPSLKTHRRMSSISSTFSTTSNSSTSSKKTPAFTLNSSSLFILPMAHRAVPHYETLIRLLIPIYDSFGLYGRPSRLKSGKKDPSSLLFALPSLPRTQILPSELSAQLVSDTWSEILATENFNHHSNFNNFVRDMISSDDRYQGFGDLKSGLNKDTSFVSPLKRWSQNISNPASGRNTPKRVISMSDIPGNYIRNRTDSDWANNATDEGVTELNEAFKEMMVGEQSKVLERPIAVEGSNVTLRSPILI